MMNMILNIAVVAILIISVLILCCYGRTVLKGEISTPLFAFSAILFTSGLDVGLIMFPLTEFPVFESEKIYQFTNPLAVEFGFWGFYIWLFYFITTFYFCLLEPRLKIFQIPFVKWANNFIIITTCSFTGYLFLSYLPEFIDGIPPFYQYGLVGLTLLGAVFSSTDVRYIRYLSVGSAWLFFSLIAAMWFYSELKFSEFASNVLHLGDYFQNLPKFIFPFSDYHAFYLYWWFAWSIMIGQFVSRFVGGLQTWQLLIALLVIPSIPIAVWFSILFGIYEKGIDVSGLMNSFMVLVGIVFVINSIDSLTRLYTEGVGLTVLRFGRAGYVTLNWLILYGLILLYQFTPLRIEWIGLFVISLYCVVVYLLFSRSRFFHLKTYGSLRK
jgi:choline-glycine betaine transporter